MFRSVFQIFARSGIFVGIIQQFRRRSAIKYIFLDALHKCHWNQHTRTNYRKSYSWLEPHTRSTEGFNGFLETREIEVSESQPEVKHNDNPLRPPFTTKNMVGSLRRLVCYTAVFIVVTQRSSPQTAAENRTTFLSLCVCGLTNKPIMYKRFDITWAAGS